MRSGDPDEPVRVWHACCATGEEVYSMAMLVREYMDERKLRRQGADLCHRHRRSSIAQARTGIYDDDICAGLDEERLRRFFTRNNGRWQVIKSLREMIVFAHHSLIKDPPFSRLDLLVCRNFLIYLNPDMQKRLISPVPPCPETGGCSFPWLGGIGRTLFRSVRHYRQKWKIFPRTGR